MSKKSDKKEKDLVETTTHDEEPRERKKHKHKHKHKSEEREKCPNTDRTSPRKKVKTEEKEESKLHVKEAAETPSDKKSADKEIGLKIS